MWWEPRTAVKPFCNARISRCFPKELKIWPQRQTTVPILSCWLNSGWAFIMGIKEVINTQRVFYLQQNTETCSKIIVLSKMITQFTITSDSSHITGDLDMILEVTEGLVGEL
jgi:hypothetical protein